MATSIKRVIVMLVFIDLLLVIMMGFASNITQNDVSTIEISNSYNGLENWTNDFNDQFTQSNPDTQVVQLDKSFGDVRFGQKKIYEILKDGIKYPFSYNCIDIDCSNTYQSAIQSGVKWFIILVNVFAIMDIIFIAYSKKYD